MKRLLTLVLLTTACLSIMTTASVAGVTNKLVIKPETGDNITSLFNPKEMTVKKSTPWKHHHILGLDAPTLGFDDLTIFAEPRPGLTILGPNPQTTGLWAPMQRPQSAGI